MTVFWIIGAAGAVLLVLSLVVGDLLHGVFDSIDFTGGYLSTAAIGGFAGGLGFAGAAVTSSGGSTGFAVLVGALTGVVFAAIASVLTRSLMRMQSGPAATADDFLGVSGRVVTAIRPGHSGEVLVTVNGSRKKLNARSDLMVEIPEGTEVWISSTLSPTSVVVEHSRPALY